MILDRHTAHNVITGKVTEHRLPVSPDLPSRAIPRRGRIVPIRTPAGYVGSVEIRRCQRSPTGHLDTLTDTAIRALGHDTLTSWARQWLLERDQPWLRRRCVAGTAAWTGYDEAVAALATLDDDEVLDRFDARWAHRPVWQISWEPVQHPPRLLAQTGSVRYVRLPSGRWRVDMSGEDPESDHGYTTRPGLALVGEPESIDTDRLRPKWTLDALARHAKARDARARAAALTRGLRVAA